MSSPLPTHISAEARSPPIASRNNLIPRCFPSVFHQWPHSSPDPPSSSPPLILPRAENSSPCSNTASPAGWKFSSLRLFNFHSLACAALRSPALPTSGMLRRFFFSLSLSLSQNFSGGREERTMHCAPLLASWWTLGRQQTVAICVEKSIAARRSWRIFSHERRLFLWAFENPAVTVEWGPRAIS